MKTEENLFNETRRRLETELSDVKTMLHSCEQTRSALEEEVRQLRYKSAVSQSQVEGLQLNLDALKLQEKGKNIEMSWSFSPLYL